RTYNIFPTLSSWCVRFTSIGSLSTTHGFLALSSLSWVPILLSCLRRFPSSCLVLLEVVYCTVQTRRHVVAGLSGGFKELFGVGISVIRRGFVYFPCACFFRTTPHNIRG
ncbi:unnamed protein product, partial [Ectocarpus sp. 12 AP-2014]